MLERAEELKQRIRETPLDERLDNAKRRIGRMCSEGRPPRMTIPVQYDDDDFYISTTLSDAQATIADLQGQIAVERANKESAVACVDRDVKKISALQQRVAQLEGELERMKAIKHDDNTQMERAESDKWDAKDHASTLMQRAIYAEGRVRALLKDGDDKDARIKALIIDNDNYRRKYHALQADHARVLGLVQALMETWVNGRKVCDGIPLTLRQQLEASLPAQPAQGGA